MEIKLPIELRNIIYGYARPEMHSGWEAGGRGGYGILDVGDVMGWR